MERGCSGRGVQRQDLVALEKLKPQTPDKRGRESAFVGGKQAWHTDWCSTRDAGDAQHH